MDTQWTADWIKTHINQFLGEDLRDNHLRINSIATDTCNTMIAVHKMLLKDPQFSHVFMTTCEAHGIQLLIKDLLEIPYLTDITNKAGRVVNAFTNAHKQLGLLRQIQREIYGKSRAFCLSVITRWGTQYRMFVSLLRNKAALREYFSAYLSDDAGESIKSVAPLVDSETFWDHVKILEALLQPISEQLKMTEANRASIAYTIFHWIEIQQGLLAWQVKHPWVIEKEALIQLFEQRYRRQIVPTHVLAFILNPQTTRLQRVPVFTSQELGKILHDFFIQQGQDPVASMRSVGLFHERQGIWAVEDWIWVHAKDPAHFWTIVEDYDPTIGRIARRLMATIASLVPSERAFFFQNLIHNKIRNLLAPARVDKLQFIYQNERVLKDIREDHAAEQELVELEDLSLIEELRYQLGNGVAEASLIFE